MDLKRRAEAFIVRNSASEKWKALLQKINFYFAVTKELSGCESSDFLCGDEYACWHKHLDIPSWGRHGEKEECHSLGCFLTMYFTSLSGIIAFIMYILLFLCIAIMMHPIITPSIQQQTPHGKNSTQPSKKKKRTAVKRKKQDEELGGVNPGSITASKSIQNMTALPFGKCWHHNLDSP